MMNVLIERGNVLLFNYKSRIFFVCLKSLNEIWPFHLSSFLNHVQVDVFEFSCILNDEQEMFFFLTVYAILFFNLITIN